MRSTRSDQQVLKLSVLVPRLFCSMSPPMAFIHSATPSEPAEAGPSSTPHFPLRALARLPSEMMIATGWQRPPDHGNADPVGTIAACCRLPRLTLRPRNQWQIPNSIWQDFLFEKATCVKTVEGDDRRRQSDALGARIWRCNPCIIKKEHGEYSHHP